MNIGGKLNPKIYVIIPTYNAEKHFMKAFNSILNQSFGYENIELVIIDDNSNDSTKDILKDLSQKYDNINLILMEENSGSPSKGRNIGIKESSADYIMFLDQDDFYHEEICEKLYGAAREYEADIVNCRIIFYKDGKYIKEVNALDKKDKVLELNSIDDDPSFLVSTSIWNKIYKKSFILENEISFAVKELYEDTYFNVQAFIKASKIISLNDYYGIYYSIRESEDDKSTSKNFNKENLLKMYGGFKNIFSTIEKNGKSFPEFESQTLMGLTKWLLLSDCEKECKLKIYKETERYFKRYNLFVRLENVSIIKNILMNIFMKFIGLDEICFKLILNLFDIGFLRQRLQGFHYTN